MIKKIVKSTFIIGLIGFFVSFYALILHIKNLMKAGGGSLCDVNATVSCSSVIGSQYGEFAAIPLGAYGMTYFAILIAIALTPKFAQTTSQQLAKLELIVALPGLVIVGILMFISYGILKMVCPTCVVIHCLVILYAILKLIQYFRIKNQKIDTLSAKDSTQSFEPSHRQNNVYSVFFGLALCLGIPPLVVGLLSPALVDVFGKDKPQQTDKKIESKQSNQNKEISPVETPSKIMTSPKALMMFNKSNYVDNGEDYRRGDDNAAVVVQIFSDFGCPHCKTANDALVRAQNTVGLDKVILVYRFYPLSNECNTFVGAKGWYIYNCSLVVAARCAGQQGKFWEFKEWAFSGQEWTDQSRAQNFSSEGLQTQAKKLKINVEAFSQCMNGHTEDNKIKDDIAFANSFDIQGTPMIFINGSLYQGPLNEKMFIQQFENALERKTEQ